MTPAPLTLSACINHQSGPVFIYPLEAHRTIGMNQPSPRQMDILVESQNTVSSYCFPEATLLSSRVHHASLPSSRPLCRPCTALQDSKSWQSEHLIHVGVSSAPLPVGIAAGFHFTKPCHFPDPAAFHPLRPHRSPSRHHPHLAPHWSPRASACCQLYFTHTAARGLAEKRKLITSLSAQGPPWLPTVLR